MQGGGIVLKVKDCSSLPKMDGFTGTCDPYVKVEWGKQTLKTQVVFVFSAQTYEVFVFSKMQIAFVFSLGSPPLACCQPGQVRSGHSRLGMGSKAAA